MGFHSDDSLRCEVNIVEPQEVFSLFCVKIDFPQTHILKKNSFEIGFFFSKWKGENTRDHLSCSPL